MYNRTNYNAIAIHNLPLLRLLICISTVVEEGLELN